MNAYFVIQRKMQYILTDANDNLLVRDLKCVIESIINVSPENQQLYHNNKILDETKTLSACGLSSYFASARHPATIGLALKMDNGEFEKLELTPYPMQPEMPFTKKIPQLSAELKGKPYNDLSVSDGPSCEPSVNCKPIGKLNVGGKPKIKSNGKEKSRGKPRRKTSH